MEAHVKEITFSVKKENLRTMEKCIQRINDMSTDGCKLLESILDSRLFSDQKYCTYNKLKNMNKFIGELLGENTEKPIDIIYEIGKAKETGIQPFIIAELEVAFVKKKFKDKPEILNFFEAVHTLNPFPGISEKDKMLRLKNKGITEIDYIISSNIIAFVQRAVHEDAEFYRRSFEEQKEKMKEFAENIYASDGLKFEKAGI